MLSEKQYPHYIREQHALTPHINHTHHSHPYPNTSSSVLENVYVNH